jgi:AcrR family transcriptional regulator
MSMREQIVSAAERVIREQGLARCTTKEIAEAAHCSEGAIYRHFRSKEDLFVTVLAERLPGLLPVLRTLPETVTDGAEVRATLLNVAQEAMAFFRESMAMLLSVFAEPKLLDRHRAWMQEHNAGPQHATELLADYLRAGQRAGCVGTDADPHAAAQLLLGSCYLSAYSALLAGGTTAYDDQRGAESTVRVLWQGIMPSTAR